MPSRVSQRLAERLDQIAAILREAEDLFAARFWAPASVYLGADSGAHLWYKKIDNQYRFMLSLDTGMCPLRDGSIQHRVAAAAALEKLWEACEFSEVEQERLVDEAAKAASAFLASKK
jgi:hypothetical protein